MVIMGKELFPLLPGSYEYLVMLTGLFKRLMTLMLHAINGDPVYTNRTLVVGIDATLSVVCCRILL